MSLTLDSIPADRQLRAKAWLALNRTNYSDLARQIGVHPSMVEKIFRGVRCTPARIDQLVGLGVPRELLPGEDADA